MSLHPSNGTIQRHLDGDLTTADSWEVERHLTDCAICRETRDGYERLREELAALPNHLEPPVDLWPAIAAGIAEEGDLRTDPGRRSFWTRPSVRRTLATLAVAAALTIGVALGRQFPTQEGPGTAAVPGASSGAAALASYDDPGFESAISELEAVLATMGDELQPETVAAIQANLAIIDAAIADSREALLTDPANEQLHRHLTMNMQKKIGLLRMVAGAVTLES